MDVAMATALAMGIPMATAEVTPRTLTATEPLVVLVTAVGSIIAGPMD